MKKYFLFIGLFFLFISCRAAENKEVVLQGEFKNTTGVDSVFLNSQGEQVAVKLASKFGEKGNFKFSFELQKAGYYYIACGESYCELYLTPGDNFKITADLSGFDSTLSFSGIGADNNNLLTVLKKAKPGLKRKILYAFDEARFMAYSDSLLGSKDKLITDAASKNNKITEGFVEAQKNDNLYGWANSNLMYKPYHQRYAKVKDFKTSDKFSDYLKKINLNDTCMLSIPSYVSFISSYYQSRVGEEAEKDTVKYSSYEAFLNMQLDLYSKEIKDSKIFELLTFNTLYDLVSNSGTKYVADKIAKFASETKNKVYSAKINGQIEKWKKCAPGTPLKDYKFNDINGHEVAFSSFKGKLIYIDVWATWCGPCKGEIPALKLLEEKYGKDKIVFVSVSVDEKKQPWENMVKKDKLAGVQLWAIGWKNDLCKDFNINGIPRFILVDARGMIVDPDAERPSGKINEKIDELLKKI